MPRLKPTYLPLLTSQAAQASTGALTAGRPALAIPMASVSRTLVCANASLTTGVVAVNSPATAAPTDGATQRQARATAMPAGGRPHVTVLANATQ